MFVKEHRRRLQRATKQSIAGIFRFERIGKFSPLSFSCFWLCKFHDTTDEHSFCFELPYYLTWQKTTDQ
jgi:hypothetical protein